MNPRLIIGFSLVFATLTACAGNSTLTYSVKANTTDNNQRAELFVASERVMERRLAAADVKNAQVTVLPTGTEKFTFDIRIEGPKLAPTEDNPDGTNWIATGLNGSMLTWVSPVTNPSNNEIGVELQFLPEGRDLLSTTFKGNKGKSIGIFVRDLLVSKMSINAEEAGDHIIIGGIPSSKVAQIFSEDVNVGLHVTFTPAP
jgi:preprotein translocase subunit SecD